jgi:hypothetical protein
MQHDHGTVDQPSISRRRLLMASGALLVAGSQPGTAAATSVRTGSQEPATGASRTSLITQGTQLVHADLHNHTVMSDGDGNAPDAFASMRDAGLDVAALTDHTTLLAIGGLTTAQWRLTGQLADAADDPGAYTAIRGFEWSHPLAGHVNVYNTDSFVDLLGATGMGRLYSWLTSRPGLATFNHPGRESGRFDDFGFRNAARDQMIGMELFNRRDDYLFRGWDAGRTSPLVACLNAGWRTGITGVTDEHGTDWGFPEGKGRTGMWVTENTRPAVFDAMRSRRFFATRVSGLRVDATAAGVAMGGEVPIVRGDVRFVVDIDRGSLWDGKPLHVQVLRPGTSVPEVVDVVETTAGDVVEFTVPMDLDDGDWVVLRISDPGVANDTPGPDGHPCNDWGVAYTSPWWLSPS